MHKVIWSLFLTGLVFGYGPCLLSCGPLLISYIASTHTGIKESLKTYLIFSLTRILVYVVFGLLAGFFGEWVIHKFFGSTILRILFLIFGLFLVILGFLIILERSPVKGLCDSLLARYLGKKDAKNIIIFGLIVSLAPCVPMLAMMGYIALISDTWLKGVYYMSAFGLGTILSPMIFLSMAAGWIAHISKRHMFFQRVIKILGGFILAYLGVRLILF